MNKSFLTVFHKKLAKNGCSCSLVIDPDHISYVTGLVFPYPHQFPELKIGLFTNSSAQSTIIAPFEWSQAIIDQGWDQGLVVYNRNEGAIFEIFAEKIGAHIKREGQGKGKLGFDQDNFPMTLYNGLSSKLPSMEWFPCDDLIWSERMIKSTEEIALLSKAAIIADRGIIGALNHVEGTVGGAEYTLAEFLERVRVHAFEFGSSGVGHLHIAQGEKGRTYYDPIKDFDPVRNGNLIRIDYSHHYLGYWCNTARMLCAGLPSREQEMAYAENQALIQTARKKLVPGAVISQIFQDVDETARQNQIEFLPEFGIGHGVGVSEVEPPYLTVDNDGILSAGMVIALDIMTLGPREELIHSKDTFEITLNGRRKISDFRDWDQLYAIVGCRGTH